MRNLIIFSVVGILTACGGGSTDWEPTSPLPDLIPDPAPDPRLVFPYNDYGSYDIYGLAQLSEDDARQMPVYIDGERLMVGVDQGNQHIGGLPIIVERDETAVHHGYLNDGVGRDTVIDYLESTSGSQVNRYTNPPQIQMIGQTSAEDFDRIIRAVQLLNASLPENAEMNVVAPDPGFSLRHNVNSAGIYFRSGEERSDTIYVEFVPEHDYRRGPGSAAVAWGMPNEYGYIQFNMGANSYPRDREAVILLAHELMHLIGNYGHVDSRFASIMRGTGEIHHHDQNGEAQPISLLYPVDREALHALYGRFDNGDSVSDLGPWASTSLHIAGDGEHVNFGVALRNGYAEPWAYGLEPSTDLASNPALAGTVTWIGMLLGLTPTASAVVGDARIGIDLTTMSGNADFTSLESFPARQSPGAAGTGAQWLDGDLGYTISAIGNTFRETGGDDGRLTGVFTGHQHEGAGGTLERDDLTAAFGASR